MDFLSFSPTVNILEIATSLFSVDKDLLPEKKMQNCF